MKNLISWGIFESLESKSSISIDDFLDKIGMDPRKKENISEWWKKNRPDFNIYYFPFDTPQPIGGSFLGKNDLLINARVPIPPFMKLMILLHESRHCDQHRDGNFMPAYFQTVVDGNKEEFLKTYKELERDANDFAVDSMKELGFSAEMEDADRRGMVRGNENAGNAVFSMMSADIEKYAPKDFFELLKKQIGLTD